MVKVSGWIGKIGLALVLALGLYLLMSVSGPALWEWRLDGPAVVVLALLGNGLIGWGVIKALKVLGVI